VGTRRRAGLCASQAIIPCTARASQPARRCRGTSVRGALGNMASSGGVWYYPSVTARY